MSQSDKQRLRSASLSIASLILCTMALWALRCGHITGHPKPGKPSTSTTKYLIFEHTGRDLAAIGIALVIILSMHAWKRIELRINTTPSFPILSVRTSGQAPSALKASKANPIATVRAIPDRSGIAPASTHPLLERLHEFRQVIHSPHVGCYCQYIWVPKNHRLMSRDPYIEIGTPLSRRLGRDASPYLVRMAIYWQETGNNLIIRSANIRCIVDYQRVKD
jgi:hypothetical protein